MLGPADQKPAAKGVPVVDVLHFFHGDGPGKERGGHSGCIYCSGGSSIYHDLMYYF